MKSAAVNEALQARLARYQLLDDMKETIAVLNACLGRLDLLEVSDVASVSHPSVYELPLKEQEANLPGNLAQSVLLTTSAAPPTLPPSTNPPICTDNSTLPPAPHTVPSCPPDPLPPALEPKPLLPSLYHEEPCSQIRNQVPPISFLPQLDQLPSATQIPQALSTVQLTASLAPNLSQRISEAHGARNSRRPFFPSSRVNDYTAPRQPPLTTHVTHNSHHPEAVRTGVSPPFQHSNPVPFELPLSHSEKSRLKNDLMRGYGDPFDGKPEYFLQWSTLLSRRMQECQADALDCIQILIENTRGEVKDSIKNFLSAGLQHPELTLEDVWDMLKKRYGDEDRIAESVEHRLRELPRVKDTGDQASMRRLVDTCKVASSAMLNNLQLAYLNSTRGIDLILEKLPVPFFNRWLGKHQRHKGATGANPDFHLLVEFLSDILDEISLPYLKKSKIMSSSSPKAPQFKTLQTHAQPTEGPLCPYHHSNSHTIAECIMFGSLLFRDRKQFASDMKLCFKCLGPHRAASCPNSLSLECKHCRSPAGHVTSMHRAPPNQPPGGQRGGGNSTPSRGSWKPSIEPAASGRGRGFSAGPRNSLRGSTLQPSGGGGYSGHSSHRVGAAPGEVSHWNSDDQDGSSPDERRSLPPSSMELRNACTSFGSPGRGPRVCSKTLLVDIRCGHGGREPLRGLCILDDQSNASFCHPSVLNYFGLPTLTENYSLTTMNGTIHHTGESIAGLQVKGVNQGTYYALPPLLTHPALPDTRSESATSQDLLAIPHLAQYHHLFPSSTQEYEVILLVGANCGELMHVLTIGSAPPYIQQTPLGPALVGPLCPDVPASPRYKSFCTFSSTREEFQPITMRRRFVPDYSANSLGDPFETREDDDLPAMSQEDILFMDIISNGIEINDKGNLEMPLPLKPGAPIPNNRASVYCRTRSTLSKLQKNPRKLESSLKVFGEYLEAGHVEPIADPYDVPGKVCFLPIFPIYNERKGKTRLVWDPSATIKGECLNDALLQGPDQVNKLIGVLMRFRLGEVGFVVDIEKMFHSFYVRKEHRDLLRFFWYKDNSPEKPLIQYRSNVMIFGSRASPACATYGLRHATKHPEAQKYPEACQLLTQNVYVDDCLGSTDDEGEAVRILQESIHLLSRYNIHLHKLCSSSPVVMDAFPTSEWSEVALAQEPSASKALGLIWNPVQDSLGIVSNVPNRPFTKRGVLATINSTYDPLGILSPVLLQGKIIQREVLPQKGRGSPSIDRLGWDDPLPAEHKLRWNQWLRSLDDISLITIPRCHKPKGFGKVSSYELHCFSDASKDSIGYVIYLLCWGTTPRPAVAFVHGSSRVSPRSADTIPRLELCAAMAVVRAACRVRKELRLPLHQTFFYTDSLVVLGYLKNTSKRFSRYVARRVEEILKYSDLLQWSHLAGRCNVGDVATRPHSPSQLIKTDWLTGPSFLLERHSSEAAPDLPEVPLPEAMESKTKVLLSREVPLSPPHPHFLDRVFLRTNSFKKALSILTICFKLFYFLRHREPNDPLSLSYKAKLLLIKYAQAQSFPQIQVIQKGGHLPPVDPLSSLSPFLDENQVLRVGGRIRNSSYPSDVIHPILLPKTHPLTRMIIDHYHSSVRHQGRVLTLGAIRAAGYHIFHGSAVIKRFLAACVFCRRLRGQPQTQLMSDLPSDRLEATPPFSHCGIDMFGPFLVHDGKTTRRTQSSKKVWCLLITCLFSRAVHVEVVPAMDTVSFELAMRRFFAIRESCISIRSDHGSNFLGALDPTVDPKRLERFASSHGVRWTFAPPKASSYGGVWERKIASVKSILNATLLLVGKHSLSRDEFSTLIAESTNIVNNTPLWGITSDPNDPCPLSPSVLLTLKDNSLSPNPEEYAPEDLLQYGKKRWRRVGYLADQFWVRRRRSFLSHLQERKRWKTPNNAIQVGDVVLLKGTSKRNLWPMGLVVSAEPGKDGLVRRVLLKLGSKTQRPGALLERSVRDTVLLVSKEEAATFSGGECGASA